MASKRGIRRRACAGKRRHATKQAASAHWFKLHLKDAEPMTVYRCKFCRGWHVGHRMAVRKVAV